MLRQNQLLMAVRHSYTYADYYLHQKKFDEAVPYLRKVIKHEMRRKQKAREYFLLGQLYAALGKRDDAYKAFRSVVRMNPPYRHPDRHRWQK